MLSIKIPNLLASGDFKSSNFVTGFLILILNHNDYKFHHYMKL